MNKTILGAIFVIFLIIGIASVGAVELQSCSGNGGVIDQHQALTGVNNYVSALCYGDGLDHIVIDIPRLPEIPFIPHPVDFQSAGFDGFNTFLPDIPYFPDPVIYH